ncbi:phosphotransferase family protein, partial [Candidatus Halobonum tyrrellensis]
EADATGRAALTRAAGRALAAVHADRFDAHGRVVGGGANGLDVDRGPWTDVLRDRVGTLRGLATSERFDDHFDAVADAVAANRDLLDDAPAALVHGDPAAPNGFLADDGADTGGRVGLLDWELVHVGDPARELVRARRQLLGGADGAADERLVAALHDGYRERAGSLPDGFERRRPVYEAVTFLGVSGYVDRLAEFRDEPLDEFAAWVDAEMDRRLARVA